MYLQLVSSQIALRYVAIHEELLKSNVTMETKLGVLTVLYNLDTTVKMAIFLSQINALRNAVMA